MRSYLWWIRQWVLTLAATFFFCYGISLFKAAYKLNDPFTFIMMIFASNLIILVNATLLIGFVYRMINVYKLLKKETKKKEIETVITKNEGSK